MNPFAPHPPEDFNEFWAEAMTEAHQVGLDYHRSLTNDFDLPGFTVETIEFATVNGRRLHGWLAFPPGARRLPSFVWLPPYGRESRLPDAYGTRPGFASLSFNFHGHAAFHQEKYVQARGYFADGVESPETWIFRQMIQDSYVATRVLQAQVEVDEDRMGVMGMSQGGGLAIALGAWCPIIKVVCADMPFLGGIRNTLLNQVYRYPLKELADAMTTIPLGEVRIMNTLAYFDTINQATQCTVPTLVSLGLRDPACRPETVQAIYDALPGSKKLEVYDWGHDWHPSMIGNNQQWLREHLSKSTPQENPK